MNRDTPRVVVTPELATILEHVNVVIGDALDSLERDGAQYARDYALAFVNSAGKNGPPAPRSMPTPVARLVRELVIDELQHLGDGDESGDS